MLDLHPILLAALTGFISGLLLSIPVGPVNLTIMNEGARQGFFWALLIGLGATGGEAAGGISRGDALPVPEAQRA